MARRKAAPTPVVTDDVTPEVAPAESGTNPVAPGEHAGAYHAEVVDTVHRLKLVATDRLLGVVNDLDQKDAVALPFDMTRSTPVVLFAVAGRHFASTIDADEQTVDGSDAEYDPERKVWTKTGDITTGIPLSELGLWSIAHLVDTVQALVDAKTSTPT